MVHLLERNLQRGHVIKPSPQDTEDVVDCSWNAQGTDVLPQGAILEVGWIPVHPAESQRLHTFGQPSDAMGKPYSQA